MLPSKNQGCSFICSDIIETTPPPSLLQFNLPTSAPADISPGVQSGSVSPFLEQTEGSKVNEDLYQAWILSSWTKTLLENPQPGTHLTCPSLMTDIILVRLLILVKTHQHGAGMKLVYLV